MRLLILPALALAALFVVACGDSGEGGKIEVTLTEWEISIDKDSVPRGPIDFTINNDGDETHEFVVIKTDIAADELQTTDDGSVDEDAPGIDVKQEVEDIESGDKTGRTYELDAGNYVLICNIVDGEGEPTESHYENGMRQGLTVEEK